MADLRLWFELDAQCQSETCRAGENRYGCSVKATARVDIPCARLSSLWCENRLRLHLEELYETECAYCGVIQSFRHWHVRTL